MPGVPWAYDELRSGGRGKHVGSFSYYHARLVAEQPRVEGFLGDLCRRSDASFGLFNVVKLDRKSRVSFLQYEDFKVPFPALRCALSCDTAHGVSRRRDYAARRNPPILHRKELLLPADHPLVADAERLTSRLEALGAFADAKSIGTREGWRLRLRSLGIEWADGTTVGIACPRP